MPPEGIVISDEVLAPGTQIADNKYVRYSRICFAATDEYAATTVQIQ
jgi:hypothetical protein